MLHSDKTAQSTVKLNKLCMQYFIEIVDFFMMVLTLLLIFWKLAKKNKCVARQNNSKSRRYFYTTDFTDRTGEQSVI